MFIRNIIRFYSSLQINKLESEIQRLNQTIERQKNTETQLRAQLSDSRTVRKDLDDLRAEHSSLQIKFVIFFFLTNYSFIYF